MPTIDTNEIGSGGGRDYSTINAWWAAECDGVDVVSGDIIAHGRLHNDSAFSTGGLNLDGATVDSTRYPHISVAGGDEWDPAAGTGLEVQSGGSATNIFELTSSYTRITGGIYLNYDSSSSGDMIVFSGATGYHLDRLFIAFTGYGAQSWNAFFGGYYTSWASCQFTNIIIDANTGGGSLGMGLQGESAGGAASSTLIANIIVYGRGNLTTAFEDTGDAVVRNCYSIDTTNFEGGTSTDIDYCLSTSGTVTGSNSTASITEADTFIETMQSSS